ncbi:hypothetical protein C5746_02315 [Streptomyces atratus]|uniref:Uncharacterized protein n=1 Tax=Streptomyces atratus TaxID=1893 RepID=A0A2Z5J6R0_STRAR|nr:hypothetical protein C5746_02315 [Streptomyces atratus]
MFSVPFTAVGSRGALETCHQRAVCGPRARTPTNRNSPARYGPHWAGSFTVTGNGCRRSALDLLNAAQDS